MDVGQVANVWACLGKRDHASHLPTLTPTPTPTPARLHFFTVDNSGMMVTQCTTLVCNGLLAEDLPLKVLRSNTY